MPSNHQRIGHAILAIGLLGQVLPLPAGNTCGRRVVVDPTKPSGSPSERVYLRSLLAADHLTWRRSTLEARLMQARSLSGEALLQLWKGLTEADYQAWLEREIAANQRQLVAPEQPVDHGAMVLVDAANARLEAALERLPTGSRPAAKGSPREEERASAWVAGTGRKRDRQPERKAGR